MSSLGDGLEFKRYRKSAEETERAAREVRRLLEEPDLDSDVREDHVGRS